MLFSSLYPNVIFQLWSFNQKSISKITFAPCFELVLLIQQGLEIRSFWFQEKTVQLKTVLHEVYTYVLNEIFFQKTVYLQGFCSKSVFREVTPMY